MPTPRDEGPIGGVRVPAEAVCLWCGYSLRGLPRAICPECGHSFDPEDPRTWWDQRWPWTTRIWRRWLGPLPLWHKVLTVVATLAFLEALSFQPYRRIRDIEVLQMIGSSALLIGLLSSYLLRRRAAQLCFIHGWVATQHLQGRGYRSRIVRICGWLVIFSLVLAPLGVGLSLRVLLSMPFLEYKAYEANRSGQPDNCPQFVGLFHVERVGLLSDRGIKLQFHGWYGGEALVYYSWAIPTPPHKRTGLTRWYWMTW